MVASWRLLPAAYLIVFCVAKDADAREKHDDVGFHQPRAAVASSRQASDKTTDGLPALPVLAKSTGDGGRPDGSSSPPSPPAPVPPSQSLAPPPVADTAAQVPKQSPKAAKAKETPVESAAAAATAAAGVLSSSVTTSTTTRVGFVLEADKAAGTPSPTQMVSGAPADPGGPQGVVLVSIAMCDSLTCPADYAPVPYAYQTQCASLVCKLDVDLGTCCGKKLPWWTYLLAALSPFCYLSMLCSLLGAVYNAMTKPKQQKTRTAKIKDVEQPYNLPAISNDPRNSEHSDSTRSSGNSESALLPKSPSDTITPMLVSPHLQYPSISSLTPSLTPQAMLAPSFGPGYVV